MLMFSLTLAPLNSSVSVPSPPSTVSLPSPGFQMKVSSPAPSWAVSLPRPPMTTSLPSPPSSVSLPSPPVIVSLPAPPSMREVDQAGEAVARRDDVVAAVGVDHEVLGGADVDVERRRRDAIEAHARAVRRDGERLGAVAAVDLGGVVAVAALEQVVVVARIPDHRVVAGLAEHLVVAVAAGQRVVAGAAEQQVVAALAEEDVVAGLAEQLVVRPSRRSACRCRCRRTGWRRAARRSISSSASVSSPSWPNTWINEVLATVAVPPRTGTAPPFTRSLPAASRLSRDGVLAGVADHGEHSGVREKASFGSHWCCPYMKFRPQRRAAHWP